MQTLYPWLVRIALLLLLPLLALEIYLSLIALGGTPRFEHADKVMHFLMHATNLGLVAAAFPAEKTFKRLLIPLLLLGPMIEVLQHFSPPREASFLDQLANLAGLAVAYWIATTWFRPWFHGYATAPRS